MSDEPQSTILKREVDRAIAEGREALTLFQSAAAEGMADSDVRRTVRKSAIQLYNTMRQWREDPQVADMWADKGLDQFGRALNTRIKVPTQRGGIGRGAREIEHRSKIAEWPTQQLATVIDDLIDIARELGFLPETTDKNIQEMGTIEDIRWLVNTREQDKSIEALAPPENDPETLPDGGVAAGSGGAETPTGPEGPDTPPEPSIENPARRFPFRGPFFQLVAERKQQGKDAKIAVSSANAETGVGKSTCAFYLALALDTSSDGFDVSEQATLGVDEFLNAYDRLEKGSALILDEAEQLTGRRAMAERNVKAGERWQMRRVQEVCSLLTLPKFSVLDPLMKDLVDYRVEVERRGEATIYKKTHQPFGDTWWRAIQSFQYPDMDGTAGMERLHDLKEEFIEEEDEGMVSQSEKEQDVQKATEDARREERDRFVRQLSKAGKTQQEIADTLEEEYGEDSDLAVSRVRVHQILNDGGG